MKFLPLYAAVALDLAAFGMAFTDIAIRARSYGAVPWVVGLLLSSYFLFQIVSSPRWGSLSDRVGRRPIAVVCTALSALSMVVYACFPNLWGILASRVLAGLGAANLAVVQASLADATEGDARAEVLGRVSAALNVGLILGFAGGGLIAEKFGPGVMGMVGASLSGLATLLLALSMPRAAPKPSEKKTGGFGLGLLKEYPLLVRLFTLAAVGWFALACLEGTFAQLLEIRYGKGQATFGWILMYELLLGFVLQGLLFQRLQTRFGPSPLLRAGYLLQGLGLGLTPFAPNIALLVAVTSLYAIGKGLADPSMSLMTSSATPDERQGEMFGLLQSARYVGFLGGPSLGGYLFGLAPAAPYVLAGAVSMGASLLAAKDGTSKVIDER